MTGTAPPSTPQITNQSMRIAWVFGAAAFLLQVGFSGRYGYFRDELYYIACSNHLAFGYVDMAPLTPWLARASHYLFGDSLHAIRLLPALGFAINVILTGYIVGELGGKRWAMGMACVAVLLAPVILGNGTRLAMNPLEPCFWMGCVYVLLLALNRQQPKLLVWCGVLLGFGLAEQALHRFLPRRTCYWTDAHTGAATLHHKMVLDRRGNCLLDLLTQRDVAIRTSLPDAGRPSQRQSHAQEHRTATHCHSSSSRL